MGRREGERNGGGGVRDACKLRREKKRLLRGGDVDIEGMKIFREET